MLSEEYWLLTLAIFCELLLRLASLDGFDEFQVGIISAHAVLEGRFFDIFTGIPTDVILQFFGLDVGWFFKVEICFFEVFSFFLDDGGDVVSDDDYLAVS